MEKNIEGSINLSIVHAGNEGNQEDVKSMLLSGNRIVKPKPNVELLFVDEFENYADFQKQAKIIFLNRVSEFMPWDVLEDKIWVDIKDRITPYLHRHKIPTYPIKSRNLFELLDWLTPYHEILGARASGMFADSSRLSVRLMITVLFIQTDLKLSQEATFKEWSQNKYYQYFSGIENFEFGRSPCHFSQLDYFTDLVSPKLLYDITWHIYGYAYEIIHGWPPWDSIAQE